MNPGQSVSIVIPTYRRESVLLDTVGHLLDLKPPASEIIVVDQTPTHEAATTARLQQWHDNRQIRWIQLSRPSIPHAMNTGLLAATSPIVLFVDDDVSPAPDLVQAHRRAHRIPEVALVAGRAVQPWEVALTPEQLEHSPFASLRSRWARDFIGCNFSVDREIAIGVGGFDENFQQVAYRFEAEFAARIWASGKKIHYEPEASLHHLKIPAGGTRTFGDHLTTARPGHSMGAYYFFWRTRPVQAALAGSLGRLLRSVRTRHHLRRPWFIPLTLAAELGGLCWGLFLHLRGPRYIQPGHGQGGSHA